MVCTVKCDVVDSVREFFELFSHEVLDIFFGSSVVCSLSYCVLVGPGWFLVFFVDGDRGKLNGKCVEVVV